MAYAKSTDAQEQAKSAFFQMIASEHREMFRETAKRVDAISTFGDMPLVAENILSVVFEVRAK